MTRNIKIRTLLFGLALVALGFGFRAMLFGHLPDIFSAPEEDLSYAWYVPVFSLYVLWTERAALVRSLGLPSFLPLIGLLPCALVGVLGVRGLQVRFELLSFIGFLILLPWVFFGRKTAQRVLFPALFLLFCMPLASYLSLITVHLRLFVSAVAGGILSGFGMDLVREGNMIALPGVIIAGQPFVIDIANPCSGLRSIFALLALAAGYGYFTQPTWVRRGILFALAVPLAVLGNILRIMSICLVAKSFDPTFAIGFYHDFSGYIVFIVALGLLIAAGGALDRFCPPARASAADGVASAGPVESCGIRWTAPVAALVFLLPTMAYFACAPQPLIAEPPDVQVPETLSVSLTQPFGVRLDERRALRLPIGDAAFVGEPVEPSVAETNLLVGAVLSKRVYRLKGAEGETAFPWFAVSSVVSGPNKNSLHRPELCLPSQGFDMGESRRVSAGGVDWHQIRLNAKGGAGATLFAYTFFNQEGYRTDSHEARILKDVCDRSFRNQVDRWAMITVQLYLADETLFQSVLASLKEVIR